MRWVYFLAHSFNVAVYRERRSYQSAWTLTLEGILRSSKFSFDGTAWIRVTVAFSERATNDHASGLYCGGIAPDGRQVRRRGAISEAAGAGAGFGTPIADRGRSHRLRVQHHPPQQRVAMVGLADGAALTAQGLSG